MQPVFSVFAKSYHPSIQQQTFATVKNKAAEFPPPFDDIVSTKEVQQYQNGSRLDP